MDDYSLALFLHIAGALGFFVGLGLEWISLRQLQRAATVEQVREWVRLPDEMSRPAMLPMLVLFLAGVYMMVTVWGGVAWIIVTLASFLPMMVLAMGITTRRMKTIKQILESERGTPSPALRELLSYPLLRLSIQTRVTMSLGIVFLMTIKPNLVESLITMGVATIIGILWSIFIPLGNRIQEESLA